MNNYISVPNSDLRLVDGNVVVLARFPGLKWVIHNSWYSYNNRQYVGWYFSSIPSGTILPVSKEDLLGIQLVASSYTEPDSSSSYPAGPFPVFPPYPDDSDMSSQGGWPPCPSKKKSITADEINQMLSGFNNVHINSISNRGYNTTCPENTLIAFKTARKHGFKYALADIRFTSDDVPVILADDTINRTGRFVDGTSFSSQVAIASLTYEQVKEFDFGIWKGATFAGTKIPKLYEFLVLCRNIGLIPYLNVQTDDEDQIGSILELTRWVGIKDVTFVSDNVGTLSTIYSSVTEDSNIRIDQKYRLGYKVSKITSEVITQINQLENMDRFLLSSSYENSEISICQDAYIPLEIYVIDDVPDLIIADPYITGVVSNTIDAGQILYKEYIK